MSFFKKSSARSEHTEAPTEQPSVTVPEISESQSPTNDAATAVSEAGNAISDALQTVSETTDKKAVNKKKFYISTIKIAYIAVLVAINVALSAISPRLGTMKITVTYTMCFLAGYFFGPLVGITVGGLGDLLGTLISGNVPNPIILVAACLLGAIPGLVKFIRIKKLGKVEWIFHLILSFILCFVICTLFINTYALYLLGLAKGATFWAYMGTRVATQSPIFAANFGLSLVLVPIFEKIYYSTVVKRMPAARKA